MSKGQPGFESAAYLAKFAGEEIAKFDKLIEEYCNDAPAKMVKEVDKKTSEIHLKAVFKPLPFSARGIASNILKNLRDALDQVVHASAQHISGKTQRNTHFPFAQNPSDFEGAVRMGPCKDIPSEIYESLKSYQPYPPGEGYDGGDGMLRLLGKISGSHKHRTALLVVPDLSGTTLGGAPGSFVQGPARIFPYLRHRPREDEAILLTLGVGGAVKSEVTFVTRVVFAHPELKTVNATDFLKVCHSKVTYIVDDLRERALAIQPRG